MVTTMDTTDLILLPGTLCDERVFAPALAPLGLRGKSIGLFGADSAPAMARRILSLAPRSFALCGFSLGAIVALEVFAQVPERITRLALICGNARTMPADTASTRRAALAVAAREGTASYIASSWEASVPLYRRNDMSLRIELEAMASATSLADFRDQVDISINRNDLRSVLKSIAVPTLILAGAEDLVCPPALSREMAARIPHARLVIVEAAGHYVTLDQPAVVGRELRNWLTAPTDIRTSLSKELS